MGTTESSFEYEEEASSSPTSTGGGGSPSAHKSSRPAANQRTKKSPRTPPPPIQKIKGIILGGPKSGKQILLQRLQGNDPYAKDSNTTDPTKDLVVTPYQPKEKSRDRT